ncbi:ABC transporter, permease protein [Fulvivirga imtechensis AK7]|uniref:ABC transporter, permease protein n=1 Tax=Fulvivirga imtechensis AK7 TaxID=1237149 RepID=L8JSM8_9BACT|nr:ABC transporter permease [Fulvivirga imtechensis]ELR71850.1 ABC transporter, permease protein [Fulvivirga imtechensis AK7]
MLKNFYKIAYRNLLRNSLFSIINILGLAFGLACFLLVTLWIWDELKYDQFHVKGEHIYKVFGELKNEGEAQIMPYSPSALAQPIVEKLPEVNNLTRVFPAETVIASDNAKFLESGIYADSSFFSIFSFPLQEGTVQHLFSEPGTILISHQLAQKYFPGESALGKSLSIVTPDNEKMDCKVSGVLAKIPRQSSLQFDFVMNYQWFEEKYRPWWSSLRSQWAYTNFNVTTYMKVAPEADVQRLNEKLGTFINDYTGLESDDALFVYPFSKLYLHSDFSQGRAPTGRIQYIRLFSIIAIVILLIACINFMNLSTARAGRRAKEVGLRKTVGAGKGQLLTQFLAESFIIVLISMAIAVTLTDILLPGFNVLTEKHLSIPFGSTSFLLVVMSLTVFTTILAGSYPALYLSSFNPAKILKSANHQRGGLTLFRKWLVIIQFTLSITFIVYAVVVYRQIEYLQNKDLGIQKENIVHHFLRGIKVHKDAYKNELLNISGIEAVSFTEHHPFNISNGNRHVMWKGKPENALIYFNVMQVDGGFMETFGTELLQGSNFPHHYSGNSDRYFIINEAAADAMMAGEPIGMELQVWGNNGKVVGLVKDFHHQSLEKQIEPVILVFNPEEVWCAFIRIGTGNPSVLSDIQTVYAKYEKEYAFDYSFVADQYSKSYNDVVTMGKLSNIFSVVAIVISCLGLFGLSVFMAEQRTKETGIRKVLGADELSIVWLFSSDFLKLVSLAFIVASPLAWLCTDSWLSHYAYRTEIGVMPFVLAGTLAASIALLTVSFNTFKAALANPVDSLKYE